MLLRHAARDERAGKALVRDAATLVQTAGAALLVEASPRLAAHADADGVHVPAPGEALEAAIGSLKPERIVGCGGLGSRDDAMRAGETDVDYLMFGEPDAAGETPDAAWTLERVRWWAEIFNVPCVGFAQRLDEVGPLAAAGAEFVALGAAVFDDARGPGAAVDEAMRAIEAARLQSASSPMRRIALGGLARAAVLLAVPTLDARAAGPTLPSIQSLPVLGNAAGGLQTPMAPITLPSPMTSDAGATGRVNPERPARPGGDLAFGAFQRGYFATALSEAMKRLKANPKDGAAMALVGEIYAQGLAVNPDPAEAARWDKLGSDQGNREATFSYALALLQGKGIAKDRAAAGALLRKAADAGHPGAFYNLGVMALQGDDGKSPNFGLAAADFQRAADGGDIDALFALATLFENGTGLPLDLARAAATMKQAADQNHVGAEVEYAIMLFNGKGVAKDETEAAKYFQKAAWQGNPIAENRLARLYAAGRGVAKDPVEAARWHILARAAGVPDTWLDGQLASLSVADKGRVEEIIRRQLGQ